MFRYAVLVISSVVSAPSAAQGNLSACVAGLAPDTIQFNSNAMLQYSYYNSRVSSTSAKDSFGADIPIAKIPISVDVASERQAYLSTLLKSNLSFAQDINYLVSYIPAGARADFFSCVEKTSGAVPLMLLPDDVGTDRVRLKLQFRPRSGTSRYRLVVYSNGKLARAIDTDLGSSFAERSIYVTWPDPTKTLSVSADVLDEKNAQVATADFNVPPNYQMLASTGPNIQAQEEATCPGRRGSASQDSAEINLVLDKNDGAFDLTQVQYLTYSKQDRGVNPNPQLSGITPMGKPTPWHIKAVVTCNAYANESPKQIGIISAPVLIYSLKAPPSPAAGVVMTADLVQIAPSVTTP